MNSEKISNYHNSISKIFLDNILAIFSIIISLPLVTVIALCLKYQNGGPVFFKQKRIGKNGKPFLMYKFRTMKVGSEKQQSKYQNLNEADGPVFKINNDPRLTKYGKILFQTGLDEIPQFINVLKGEMSFVGPRPLPIYEAKRLTKSHKVRELVKPGITSTWVVQGSHNLRFKKWMQLDKEYVKFATYKTDLSIVIQTVLLIIGSIIKKVIF